MICPGEKVTYDCVVPEEAVSITWTATPVLENTSIHFSFTTPPDQWILGCSNVSSIQCADFDFQTTLSVGPVGTNSTSAEFLVSTITYTATAELNGTVFECIGVTENGTERDWIRLTFDKTSQSQALSMHCKSTSNYPYAEMLLHFPPHPTKYVCS